MSPSLTDAARFQALLTKWRITLGIVSDIPGTVAAMTEGDPGMLR